jgi:hypothetical protein
VIIIVQNDTHIPMKMLQNLKRAPHFKYSFVFPKSIEPISRQFRIPDGMLDVPVSQVMLDRSGIVAAIGQLEATAVTEHVRMNRKAMLDYLACLCCIGACSTSRVTIPVLTLPRET